MKNERKRIKTVHKKSKGVKQSSNKQTTSKNAKDKAGKKSTGNKIFNKNNTPVKKTTGNGRRITKRSRFTSNSKQTLELYNLLQRELKNDTSKGTATIRRANASANDRSIRDAGKSIKQPDKQPKSKKQSVKIHSTGKAKGNRVTEDERIDGIGNKENKEFTEKEFGEFQKEINSLVPFSANELKYIKKLKDYRTRLNKKIIPLREYILSLRNVEDKSKEVYYKKQNKSVKGILKEKINEVVLLNKRYNEVGVILLNLYGINKKDKEFRDLKNENYKEGFIRLAMCMHFQMKSVFNYLRLPHVYEGIEHRFNFYNDMDIDTESDKILESLNTTETKMESKNVFYLQFDLESNGCYGYIDDEPTKEKQNTLLYDKSYFTKKQPKVKKEWKPKNIKPKNI